ncbi:hypothetical protein L1987_56151 [Smallanthus sonchifolius]|uniref:Uncharacterized protein n=1 Tax=Smallanthus sonchifolius TaxID=185202 RepID=A0ACB9EC33_9ASTR|nr:hypothetical protein L1987_56151 [Smallanthus sonchifolius]
MDLFSQKIKRSELKEGDHIYTWRQQIYSHHGQYFRNLHWRKQAYSFCELRKRWNSSFFSCFRELKCQCYEQDKKKNCPVSYCGSEKVAGSGVRMSCIDCFIKKGSLYRFKYEVSREFLVAKLRGGTCTTATSDPPEEVKHRANYLYENGYVEYNLKNNNCEDFALYCKTGLWSKDKSNQGRSSQANMVHPTNEEDKIKNPLQ